MKNIFRLVKGLLPLLGLLLSLSLSAQDIVVKGHVKDATGESVIGANILIKGTSIGTISDVDGNFTLKAATGNVLTVTCIGYKGQEITVTNKPLIVVTMQEDSELLDEVVVIGYGQVKKGDVTGSLLTVKPDELNKGKQLTAEDALVGKVAGVNIVPGNGAPGSGGTIRIRMGASLSADNDPLIVIDGVPVSNTSISAINPNDIASFTVLKERQCRGSISYEKMLLPGTGSHRLPRTIFTPATLPTRASSAVNCLPFVQLIRFHGQQRSGHVAFLHLSVADDYYFVQQLAVFLHGNDNERFVCHGDFLSFITDTGDGKYISGSRLQCKIAVHIGNSTYRSTFNKNVSSDNRFTGSILHMPFHHDVLC